MAFAILVLSRNCRERERWNKFAILITGALIFHRFGEESMVRIIRWLEKQKVPLDSSLLDIGTGNGVLLVELVGILQSLCF